MAVRDIRQDILLIKDTFPIFAQVVEEVRKAQTYALKVDIPFNQEAADFLTSKATAIEVSDIVNGLTTSHVQETALGSILSSKAGTNASSVGGISEAVKGYDSSINHKMA